MLGLWEVMRKHGTETGEVIRDSDMGGVDMVDTKGGKSWQRYRDMGSREGQTRKRVLIVGFGQIYW